MQMSNQLIHIWFEFGELLYFFFLLSSLIVCLGVSDVKLIVKTDYSLAGSPLLLIDLTIYCQTVTTIQTHHKKDKQLIHSIYTTNELNRTA